MPLLIFIIAVALYFEGICAAIGMALAGICIACKIAQKMGAFERKVYTREEVLEQIRKEREEKENGK